MNDKTSATRAATTKSFTNSTRPAGSKPAPKLTALWIALNTMPPRQPQQLRMRFGSSSTPTR